jgi:hypothetical protein
LTRRNDALFAMPLLFAADALPQTTTMLENAQVNEDFPSEGSERFEVVVTELKN